MAHSLSFMADRGPARQVRRRARRSRKWHNQALGASEGCRLGRVLLVRAFRGFGAGVLALSSCRRFTMRWPWPQYTSLGVTLPRASWYRAVAPSPTRKDKTPEGATGAQWRVAVCRVLPRSASRLKRRKSIPGVKHTWGNCRNSMERLLECFLTEGCRCCDQDRKWFGASPNVNGSVSRPPRP